ncbi:MAG: hypothetical protein PHV68_06380 [Candidatus Gastranaerophilales bacterium]|nr:hypothetical protein [Candidatus Gastranaerophilales bacterium]
MDNILKLYPQCGTELRLEGGGDKPSTVTPLKARFQDNYNQDRRQNAQSVDVERRSGIDRRDDLRISDDKLNSDLENIKNTKSKVDTFEKTISSDSSKVLLTALSPITPVRRISSIGDNIEDGNYQRAAGLFGLALVNLPEDTRDLKSASKQVGSKLFSSVEFKKAYDYKNYQHPFSFFRGTFLEPVVNKMGKVGEALHKADIPIYDTKAGQKICDLLDIKKVDKTFTGREVPKVYINDVGEAVIKKTKVKAIMLESAKFGKFGKFIGRTMLRIPVLSVLALGLLELPAITKAFAKDKDNIDEGLKQTAKSAINVTSILAGIGSVGAILSKKGPSGSLIGMGIGSVAGAFASKKIQDIID